VLDRKDFAGGIVADIDDVMLFIDRNTRTGWRILGLQRTDVPEYPTDGLREAVTNAVMHRDWWEVGANVFVEVFPSRIEVSNPGGLPRGLTREELGTRSVRRNPLIADLLNRINYVEKAGTGIGRMMEAARRHGCAEPRFVSNGFFTTTFWPLRDIGDVRFPSRQQFGLLERPKSGPSRDQVQVLEFCSEPRALVEIMGLFDRTNRTRFRDQMIRPLLEVEWLELTVPDRPRSSMQRYRTTDEGRERLAGGLGERK
jgi:ATP-dependent DNA helicase RecG